MSFDNSLSERGQDEVGACSTRICSLGDKKLVEEIVTYKPGRSYTYRADLGRSTMKMPIRDHLGSFELEERAGKTFVTWSQHFNAPPWPIGAMVRWYMRDRMMRPALRGLYEKFGGRDAS